MARTEVEAKEEMLKGQAIIWNCVFGLVDTIALKCAVELGIADIINSHGCPISVTQIANSIDQHSLVPDRLSRVMTLLVRRGIFSSSPSTDGNSSTLYGLTDASKFLLRDSDKSLAPFVLSHGHPLLLSLWHHFDNCVEEGRTAYVETLGMDGWKSVIRNPKLGPLLQKCLVGVSNIILEAFKMEQVRKVFEGLGSLVDVGGGYGATLSGILKEFPHIKGINFDLPGVVAEAPKYEAFSHVAGDMFASIPHADAILLKFVLHNWNDENCVKILKNCRKAIPKGTGKIIIIDIVLEPEGKDTFDDAGVAFDLMMMLFHGAKERTEAEWKMLLNEGGFPRYNILKIPALVSIIEAYPEN